MIPFEELTENPDESLLPRLDRWMTLDQWNNLTCDQQYWKEHGYVIKPNFLPEELINDYVNLRLQVDRPHGWKCDTPYMFYRELRDLCLYRPLMELLKSLIGSEMGLHLNLTGFVSTERNWHQDDYLNPPFVNSHYAAVWMALADISSDSGPFEFVDGSHRWPLLRREKIWSHLTKEEIASPLWPTISERICIPAFEQKIAKENATVNAFLPKKGDLLVWHGRLTHRGSKPRVPGHPRWALISHYSSLAHRFDMPTRAQHTNGSWYFVHPNPLDPGAPAPTIGVRHGI